MGAGTNTWPCHICAAPGYRNLGAQGHCAWHYAEVIAAIPPEHHQYRGIGLPGRTGQPDDLTCQACGATWVGPVGESCRWCAHNLHNLQRYQAELTLTPPDIDPHDERWGDRMNAWVDQITRAIDVGLVTKRDAERVVSRVQAAWEAAHHDQPA